MFGSSLLLEFQNTMTPRNADIIDSDVISRASTNCKRLFTYEVDNQNYSVHDFLVLLVTFEHHIMTFFRNIKVTNVMKFSILNDFIRQFRFAKLTHHSAETI